MIKNITVELNGESHEVIAGCSTNNGDLVLNLLEIDGKHPSDWFNKNPQDYLTIYKLASHKLMDYLMNNREDIVKKL